VKEKTFERRARRALRRDTQDHSSCPTVDKAGPWRKINENIWRKWEIKDETGRILKV